MFRPSLFLLQLVEVHIPLLQIILSTLITHILMSVLNARQVIQLYLVVFVDLSTLLFSMF